MRTKYMVITGVLSGVVMAGVVFHDKLFPGIESPTHADKTANQPAVAMPARGPAVAAPGGMEATDSVDETRPAWMNAPGSTAAMRPSATALAAEAASRERDERAARMRAAMGRLEKLQGQKDVDPKAVDDALAEVERAHGSSVLQGVRLDVLRENLRVAARLQKAATEVQSLQQRSAAGELKPAQQAELNKKLAEMEAMQRELRMDFFVSNPAPAGQ